jgi:hypothetical protein
VIRFQRTIMTIDQIISLTASIAACFAAVATFLTVWQMAQQRRASYKPELVIARSTFTSGSNAREVGLASYIDWRGDNAQQVENGDQRQLRGPHYSVRLANIGLGAAKNVSATWSFPFETFLTKTQKAGAEAMPPISIEYQNGILSSKKIGSSLWRNQTLQLSISYCQRQSNMSPTTSQFQMRIS